MLQTSADGGVTWTPGLVAGPFDETTAPSTSGEASGGIGFLGDYQTLVAVPHGFVAAYVLAQPLPGAGYRLGDPDATSMRTDVFSSRIHAD